MEPRVLAVQLPRGFQQPQLPEAQQIGDAPQKLSQQLVSQAAKNLTESNAANARIFQGMMGDLETIGQATASASAVTQATEMRTAKGGFAEIAGAVNTALNTYMQYDERRKKQQAEKDEQARQQAVANWAQQAEVLVTEAPELIRSDKSGHVGYMRKVDELMTAGRQFLKPSEQLDFMTRLYAPAKALMSEQAEATYGAYKEIVGQRRNVEQQRYLAVNIGNLVQIENETDPAKIQALTEQIYNNMTEAVKTMTPMDAMTFLGSSMEAVRPFVAKGMTGAIQMQRQTENLQKYVTEVATARNEFAASQDYDTYQVRMLELRQKYGIKDDSYFNDPESALKAAQDTQDRMYKAQQAADERMLSEAEKFSMTEAEVSLMAASFITNPQQIPIWKAKLGKNPYLQSAIEMSERFQKFQAASDKIKQTQIETQIAKARLQGQNLGDVEGWLNPRSSAGQDSLQTISRLLELQGISGLLQGAQKDALSALIQANASGKPAEVDPKVLQAARQSILDNRAQISAMLDAKYDDELLTLEKERLALSRFGLGNPNQVKETMANASQRIKDLNTRIDTLQRTVNTTPRLAPNFRMPQLQTWDAGNGAKSIIPFKPGAAIYPMSGKYAEWRDGGSRQHAGIDIPGKVGTPIISYVDGKVVRVEDHGSTGYGKMVDILGSDGMLHRFAHMDGWNVAAGATVKAGQQIGRLGNTGTSTGPHLHWEIRDPKKVWGFSGTRDPLGYLAGFQNGTGRNPKTGKFLASAPPNAMQNGDGSYIQNNQLVRGTQSSPVGYTQSKPWRQRFSPTSRTAYTNPNDPRANHGYAELAKDSAFRQKLNSVAKNVGVPTQWLADLMAFETGGTFSASADNRQGYRGLIQFGEETAAGLGTSTAELAAMSRVKQLDYVQKYLMEKKGQYDSPFQLLMQVWGGGPRFDALKRNPASVRYISDGQITFENYVKRLGEHAGRQYLPLYDTSVKIHSKYHAGCPTCQSIARSGSKIFPHEAV